MEKYKRIIDSIFSAFGKSFILQRNHLEEFKKKRKIVALLYDGKYPPVQFVKFSATCVIL